MEYGERALARSALLFSPFECLALSLFLSISFPLSLVLAELARGDFQFLRWYCRAAPLKGPRRDSVSLFFLYIYPSFFIVSLLPSRFLSHFLALAHGCLCSVRSTRASISLLRARACIIFLPSSGRASTLFSAPRALSFSRALIHPLPVSSRARRGINEKRSFLSVAAAAAHHGLAVPYFRRCLYIQKKSSAAFVTSGRTCVLLLLARPERNFFFFAFDGTRLRWRKRRSAARDAYMYAYITWARTHIIEWCGGGVLKWFFGWWIALLRLGTLCLLQ